MDKIKGKDILAGRFKTEGGEELVSTEDFIRRQREKGESSDQPVEIDSEDPLHQIITGGNFKTNDPSVMTGGNAAASMLAKVMQQKKQVLKAASDDQKPNVEQTPPAEDPRRNPNIKRTIHNPANKAISEPTQKMPSPKVPITDPNRLWSKFITKPTEAFISIDTLPSSFLFYDIGEIVIKRLTLEQLERIHFATENQSISNLLNVVSECVTNFDIRELHFNDMIYVWHFIRKVSYPKTSMKFTWNSKYGNENVYSFDLTHTETNYLEMSHEAYNSFMEKGLAVPRVKDYEWIVLNQDMLNETDKFAYARAQYLVGDSPIDKLAHLQARNDIETLELIDEFARLLDFGISEFVEVQDSQFNPEAYANILQEELIMANAAVEAATNDYGKDNITTLALMTQRTLLEAKIRDFEEAVSTDSFVPDVEKILIKPSLFNFFPLV